MWMTQKEADKYNKKKDNENMVVDDGLFGGPQVDENSPLQGDNKGNYGGLDLKRRNNIRF